MKLTHYVRVASMLSSSNLPAHPTHALHYKGDEKPILLLHLNLTDHYHVYLDVLTFMSEVDGNFVRIK